MKRLLVVIVLLAAGGLVLGFSRGWFSVDSDSGGGHSNITLTVNQDKFQEDRKAALEKVRPSSGPSAEGKAVAPVETVTAGTLVSVGNGVLTVTDGEGNEQRFTLAPDARVTCDGQECKAGDLKSGTTLRVTVRGDEPHTAVRLEGSALRLGLEKAR